ncbi:YbaB/EbfC family nucleoid-associated protein [Thermasporomyces composti]|jgi:DNA-binding protein YbaB|uniref:YbaB/EbfC DNA-binding family protein n=1 Tax=Thermasporomyces composti TaxID=696763 RepID=A0A3D9V942_THECX|nr:YbaB/EbfC family nucleoid-associated protein [Thermasporomyces composti]REF38037.1 YbaB/EbfC DNA-binding family protein [Thermasporomyces composti]
MFGFDDLPDFSLRDPAQIELAQRDQMGRLQELQERIKSLVGRAESEDGRISVAYSEPRGVHDLQLDPRALRMPSEDLAATIERLVNEARDDFRRQTAEVAQETFGSTMNPQNLVANLPQMEANLGEILQAAKESSNQIAQMAQRLLAAFPDRGRRDG